MAGAPPQNDRELGEFLQTLDEWTPTIPEEIARHFLQKTGFNSPDPRAYKLVALAVQKFVSDVAADALVHAKNRLADPRASRKGSRAKQPVVLTLDDLAASLERYNIDVHQPAYFVNAPASSAPSGSSMAGSLGGGLGPVDLASSSRKKSSTKSRPTKRQRS